MDRKQAYGEGQEMLMEVDDEDAANYSRCAVPTRPAASSERTKILRQQGSCMSFTRGLSAHISPQLTWFRRSFNRR